MKLLMPDVREKKLEFAEMLQQHTERNTCSFIYLSCLFLMVNNVYDVL
jgi:hypothetical protein